MRRPNRRAASVIFQGRVRYTYGMKGLAIVMVVLLAPTLAGASSGSVHSSASATAISGGNTAGPGGSVTTGDAAASVQVLSTINGGSTSSVVVQTNVNGATEEETYTAQSGRLEVSVQATPAGAVVEVTEGDPPRALVPDSSVAAHESAPADAHSADAPAPVADASAAESAATSPTLLQKLFSFISSLLGWF